MAILFILGAVALAMVFRHLLPSFLSIWGVVLLGAVLVLLLRLLTFSEALASIDWSMMLYLLGIFIFAAMLESSGLLNKLCVAGLRYFKQPAVFVLVMIAVMGLSSAVLLNDTAALIFVPCLLRLARAIKVSARMLLLLLAFAVTIGSVASPIGNPQNLLIASSMPFAHPFLLFARYLLVPTLINLCIIYFVFLRLCSFSAVDLSVFNDRAHTKGDPFPTALAYGSICLLLLAIAAHVILTSYHIPFPLSLVTWIAVMPLLLRPRQMALCCRIDWQTLVFFLGLFIIVGAVWHAPAIAHVLRSYLSLHHQPLWLMTFVLLVSQLISNVPAVALVLPLMQHASLLTWMYLTVGATVGGSLWIMGAASNIIILQQAKRLGAGSFSNSAFFKYGLPLTAIQIMVYVLYFHFL